MDPIKYFEENQYTHIPQLVSKELSSFLYNYLVIKGCTNIAFDDKQSESDAKFMHYCYGELTTETLLGFLVEPLSRITQKKLCPTYSYARLYLHGEILKPHLDRPACQYSVTINFGGDPWPIYFGKLNQGMNFDNGYSLLKEITLAPGDGIVYMGEELVHWRNQFEGDHCAQAFLHYIDENGPHYPEHKYDGRKNIGYRKYATK